ncbi:MAG TPA: ABC transporter substrate-binding protein [Usitatibacter sp.]|jgi:NitT/TauT family transport system substrate-binding protein
MQFADRATNLRRRLLGALAVAAAGLALGTAPAALAQGKSLTTVRLGDEIGSEADYANIWVADALGYYADEGIKIERHTYNNGPEGLLHFANGEIDMIAAGLAPFMQMAARGQQFKMIMSVTKYNAPLVGAKKYKSWKDLNGQKVGSPGLGTVQDAILSYVEKTQHIKFHRVFAKVSDFAVMAEKGEIAAFISWEPAAATAISQNPNMHYIEQRPPIKNAESLEVIVSPDFVKKNPKAVEGFVRATLKGMKYIKENSLEKTAKIVADKMNTPSGVPVVLDAMKSIDVTDPRIDMPSTKLILTAVIEAKKIPASFGKDIEGWMNQYLDYSYLDKAEKDIGWK